MENRPVDSNVYSEDCQSRILPFSFFAISRSTACKFAIKIQNLIFLCDTNLIAFFMKTKTVQKNFK